MKAPDREPTELEASKPLYLAEMPAYRAAAEVRRAAAFCDLPEFVFGAPVEPITPHSLSMLVASQNRIVKGGQPRECDVIEFIWFHSPLFVFPFHPEHRKRKRRALSGILRALNRPWRRWVGLDPDLNVYAATLAIAIADCLAITESAFADVAAATGRSRPPLSTLEAFLVHEFAVAYGWTPERTSATPLRKLFQLHRHVRLARGEDVKDGGEQDILFRHLEKKNAALKAEREKELCQKSA